MKSDSQITVPRFHIKMAARADFTGKYGLPLSERAEKSFGNVLAANCTFGKECWRSSSFKLHQSSSESGRFIRRSGNHYSTKHSSMSTRDLLTELTVHNILKNVTRNYKLRSSQRSPDHFIASGAHRFLSNGSSIAHIVCLNHSMYLRK